MKKLELYLKYELDVEFLACVHAFVMIFLYLMEKFVSGSDNIGFILALEMGIAAYASAWIQKLLFLKEKMYTKKEYRIRNTAWSLIPIVLTILFSRVCGWFENLIYGTLMELVFYSIIIAYFIFFRMFLKYFYRNETEKLNGLLNDWKKR